MHTNGLHIMGPLVHSGPRSVAAVVQAGIRRTARERGREGGKEGAPAAGSECPPETHWSDLEARAQEAQGKDEECMRVLSCRAPLDSNCSQAYETNYRPAPEFLQTTLDNPQDQIVHSPLHIRKLLRSLASYQLNRSSR